MNHVNATVPVVDKCDVLVCGGGSAGVSTAVAAARHGARVILIERCLSAAWGLPGW